MKRFLLIAMLLIATVIPACMPGIKESPKPLKFHGYTLNELKKRPDFTKSHNPDGSLKPGGAREGDLHRVPVVYRLPNGKTQTVYMDVAAERAKAMAINSSVGGAAISVFRQTFPADGGTPIPWYGPIWSPSPDVMHPGVRGGNQGGMGSCYWVSWWKAFADCAPWALPDMLWRNTKTGTIDMRIVRNGQIQIYQTDPVLTSVGYFPDSSDSGAGIAFAEKLYALARLGTNRMADVSWGSPYAAGSDLVGDPNKVQLVWTLTPDLLTILAVADAQGKIVVASTGDDSAIPAGNPAIGAHAYSKPANAVNVEKQTITLYNGWGIDGKGNDGRNEGLVTFTLPQIRQAFSFFYIMTPPPAPAYIVDSNLDGIIDATDYDAWFKHVGKVPANSVGGWWVGDFNGSGIVDATDFDLLNAKLGYSTAERYPVLSASPAVAKGSGVFVVAGGGTSMASPSATSTTVPTTQPRTITGSGAAVAPASATTAPATQPATITGSGGVKGVSSTQSK